MIAYIFRIYATHYQGMEACFRKLSQTMVIPDSHVEKYSNQERGPGNQVVESPSHDRTPSQVL